MESIVICIITNYHEFTIFQFGKVGQLQYSWNDNK
jgi:hypothetical protein